MFQTIVIIFCQYYKLSCYFSSKTQIILFTSWYMLEFEELVKKLEGIKELGWVKTHRSGNTGIGKTLEDLLGIKENNIPGPDAHMIELKSIRQNATNMLTLFTKSPFPKGANTKILHEYGYKTSERGERKILHTTVNAVEYNRLRGNIGFKLDTKDDRIELISQESNSKKRILGYWTYEILKNCFEKKLPQLMLVKARSRGHGENEEFHYNEAWFLKGFDFDNFKKLLSEGVVVADMRIGQYPDGRTHDHGTAFRVKLKNLDLCFKERERIV